MWVLPREDADLIFRDKDDLVEIFSNIGTPVVMELCHVDSSWNST